MSDEQITDYINTVFAKTLSQYKPIILAENKKSLFKRQLKDLLDKDLELQKGLYLYFYILLIVSAKHVELSDDFDDDPVELVTLFMASTIKINDGLGRTTDLVSDGFSLFMQFINDEKPDWSVFLWQCLTAYKSDYDRTIHEHAKNVSSEVIDKTQRLILFEFYEMWNKIAKDEY